MVYFIVGVALGWYASENKDVIIDKINKILRKNEK